MGVVKNIVGERFGRLVVLRFTKTPSGKSLWELKCDCGAVVYSRISDLRSGKRQSCGCLRSDATKSRRTRHGMSNTSEFRIWAGMIARCTNKTNKSFANYGGIGIKVCQEWLGDDGFVNFYTHIGPRPSKKHSIDRINNSKNYEPGNVRWATADIQVHNRRNTIKISFSGKTMTINEWSKETGIPRDTIKSRILRGINIKDALTKPAAVGKSNGGIISRDVNCPEYRAWLGMQSRCKPNSKRYRKSYYERGIYVCERWKSLGRRKSLEPFMNFVADMGLRPSIAHSIDRIDNDGPYSPENCRWATPSEQNSNKRNISLFEFNGSLLTIAKIARDHYVSPHSLSKLIKDGLHVADALEVMKQRALSPTEE